MLSAIGMITPSVYVDSVLPQCHAFDLVGIMSRFTVQGVGWGRQLLDAQNSVGSESQEHVCWPCLVIEVTSGSHNVR